MTRSCRCRKLSFLISTRFEVEGMPSREGSRKVAGRNISVYAKSLKLARVHRSALRSARATKTPE
eukprot:1628119-Pyramimonas_sp.AAC.1